MNLPPSYPRASTPLPSILVVDGDALAGAALQALEERGWPCVHCATGREARERLALCAPDLVVVGAELPDLDLTALLEGVFPPFLVCSGPDREGKALELMERGGLGYVPKDAHYPASLPGAVARALDHIQLARRAQEAEASLQLAQEGLRRALKMESLGRMAGGIAHDFNNLFQGLQGNLEVARLKAKGGPAVPFLDKALAVLGRASALTQRMLDFSGKSFRHPEPLDLDQVVQECLRPFLELSGPPLEYLPNGPLPLVEGDRAQLLQVLSGLVLNAREAQGPVTTPIRLRSWQTEPGGEEGGLWIHPPPQGTSVCLEVEDHGSGMTKEVLEKAFDPFFTTHRPGRGLGLSAALGILKAHHAGLWVSSAPGRGATFRIFLPPSPQALDPQAPRAALLPMTQVGILLVDDDEDLQATLGEFLRGILGYPVFQALDGLEAVEIYRQAREEVGIILMDATMPRMNGPDAFRIIRELNPDAQAILLSGYTEEAGNQVARESGFRSFLKKPFSLEDLGNAVKGALAR